MGKWITTVLLCLLAAAAFGGCRKSVPAQTVPVTPAPVETTPIETGTVPPTQPSHGETEPVTGGQLIATVETREEAEELAELYGIELVRYAYKIAEYHTEEDPGVVIRRGIDNGWPRLERNGIMKAF